MLAECRRAPRRGITVNASALFRCRRKRQRDRQYEAEVTERVARYAGPEAEPCCDG